MKNLCTACIFRVKITSSAQKMQTVGFFQKLVLIYPTTWYNTQMTVFTPEVSLKSFVATMKSNQCLLRCSTVEPDGSLLNSTWFLLYVHFPYSPNMKIEVEKSSETLVNFYLTYMA
jgi:hypothetical protein